MQLYIVGMYGAYVLCLTGEEYFQRLGQQKRVAEAAVASRLQTNTYLPVLLSPLWPTHWTWAAHDGAMGNLSPAADGVRAMEL